MVYVQTKPDLLGLSGQSLDILNHVIQINSSFKNEGTWSRVRVIYSYCHWGTVSDLVWHHRAVPWLSPSLTFLCLKENVRVRSRNFRVNLDELPVAVGAARALLFSREGTMFTAPSVPCARSVGVNRKRVWDIEVLEDFLWVGESEGTAVCACARLMPVSCGCQSRGSPVHWVKLYWLSFLLPPPHTIKLYLNVDCVFCTVKIFITVLDNNNRVNAKSNGSHDTDPDTTCLQRVRHRPYCK